MLGLDAASLMAPLKVRPGKHGQPCAELTPLAWFQKANGLLTLFLYIQLSIYLDDKPGTHWSFLFKMSFLAACLSRKL
jgi:hypothetical protein